jgi:hypothetical protein
MRASESKDMDGAGLEGVLEEFTEHFVPDKGLARASGKVFFSQQGDVSVTSLVEGSINSLILCRAITEAFDQALL